MLEGRARRLRAAWIATNHQNCVVASNGAEDICELSAVDRNREQLRLARSGLHDDQLLRHVDAEKKLP